MVRLDHINEICARRRLANSRPAQVFCRLLGNDRQPCPADRFCQEVEKRGLRFFYLCLVSGLFFGLTALFWVLRITRLSRLFAFVLGLFIPPLKWVVQTIKAMKDFFDSLFE
jgi:hypothetical protein